MVVMDGVNSFSYRGIMIDTSGLNDNSEVNYIFEIQEDQAPSTPLLMLYGAGYLQNISLDGAVMDSTLAPAVANWSGGVNGLSVNYVSDFRRLSPNHRSPRRGSHRTIVSACGFSVGSKYRIQRESHSADQLWPG